MGTRESLEAEVRRLRDELHERDTEAANLLRERFIAEMSILIVALLTGGAFGYWLGTK